MQTNSIVTETAQFQFQLLQWWLYRGREFRHSQGQIPVIKVLAISGFTSPEIAKDDFHLGAYLGDIQKWFSP